MSAEPDVHADCIRFDEERGANPKDLTRAHRRHLATAMTTFFDAVSAAAQARDLPGAAFDVAPDHAYKLADAIEALPSPGERYTAMISVLGDLCFDIALHRNPPPPPAPLPGRHTSEAQA